jgi:hypothetical protein
LGTPHEGEYRRSGVMGRLFAGHVYVRDAEIS